MFEDSEVAKEVLAQMIEDYLTEEYQVRGTFSPDKAGIELAYLITRYFNILLSARKER